MKLNPLRVIHNESWYYHRASRTNGRRPKFADGVRLPEFDYVTGERSSMTGTLLAVFLAATASPAAAKSPPELVIVNVEGGYAYPIATLTEKEAVSLSNDRLSLRYKDLNVRDRSTVLRNARQMLPHSSVTSCKSGEETWLLLMEQHVWRRIRVCGILVLSTGVFTENEEDLPRDATEIRAASVIAGAFRVLTGDARPKPLLGATTFLDVNVFLVGPTELEGNFGPDGRLTVRPAERTDVCNIPSSWAPYKNAPGRYRFPPELSPDAIEWTLRCEGRTKVAGQPVSVIVRATLPNEDVWFDAGRLLRNPHHVEQ